MTDKQVKIEDIDTDFLEYKLNVDTMDDYEEYEICNQIENSKGIEFDKMKREQLHEIFQKFLPDDAPGLVVRRAPAPPRGDPGRRPQRSDGDPLFGRADATITYT